MRTPLLKEQHDFNIQTNIANAGGEIYGAYAPTNFLAVSFGYASSKDTSVKKNRFQDFEFAATPFLAKEKLRLEMPMGLAYTRQISLDKQYSTFQPYSRYFVQPTVAFASDVFDIALAHRMTFIDYANVNYDRDLRQQTSLVMRVGYKYAKFMIQFGVDYGTQNSKLVDYYPVHIGLGLNFQFNGEKDIFKKKAQP